MAKPVGYPVPSTVLSGGSLLNNALNLVVNWSEAAVDWVTSVTAGQLEDLRFPAQAINPPGAPSDPSRDTSTGLLNFSATVANVIAGVAQLPHGRKPDTVLTPHLHVFCNSSPTAPNDVVRWQLQYRFTNINGARPAAYTTLTVDHTVAAYSGGQPIHQIVAWSDIVGTGLTASSMMEWIITRVATNAADNYPGTVALLEFDVHFTADQLGRPIP